MLLLFSWGFSAVYGASGPAPEAPAAPPSAEASGVFRIITLKHISAKQGREYLSQIGIGPASELSGSPSLLVTGKAEDVARAKVMLDLVDSPQEFAVKVMGSSLKAEILPSSEAISEKAGGIAVGTFSTPPQDSSGAIVDVHNGSLAIIAQASRIDRVVAAVGKLLKDKHVPIATFEVLRRMLPFRQIEVAEIMTGMDAGAMEYIIKPFAPDQLSERVQEILSRAGVG